MLIASELLAAKKSLSSALLSPKPANKFAAFSAFAAASPDPDLNVVGVGVGFEVVDGKRTSTPAVKVFVRRKFAPDEIAKQHLLPASINGMPVDVEEAGTFVKQGTGPDPKAKFRPAQPGCSIGFADPAGAFVMAGTFGALVQKDGNVFILSNNHVLADENRLPLNSPIFQPGLLDGGDAALDGIATLSQFVTLDTVNPNSADCAIAMVNDLSLVDRSILDIGVVGAPMSADIGMLVEKFGRTTRHTHGTVTSVATDVQVGYEIGTLTFTDQIIIEGTTESFSAAGDSGSLIVQEGSHEPVALLFAGSDTHTIGNHIDVVLSALNVSFA
jgi:hypothetical protein